MEGLSASFGTQGETVERINWGGKVARLIEFAVL